MNQKAKIKWENNSKNVWRIRSKIFIFFTCLFFAGAINASGFMVSDKTIYRIGRRDGILGSHLIDGRTGWAVGDHGTVLKTADGGENWQRVEISGGIVNDLNDVFFVGDNGWIIGTEGLILHTHDGGKMWKKQSSNTDANLMSLFFIDQNKGFAIGPDGLILNTLNGGTSWEEFDFNVMDILPNQLLAIKVRSIDFYDIVFLDQKSGWIVGDYGTILHTEDGGKAWYAANIGPFPFLYAIHFKNQQQAWAVGLKGFVLETNDGGKTWKPVNIGTQNNLYDVQVEGNTVVIVGDKGSIFGSSDAGKSWEMISHGLTPPYPWFASVWIIPSNSAKILAMGKGVILKEEVIK